MMVSPTSADRSAVARAAWIGAAWLLACWALWDLPLNNDLGWQYWVARQLRHGFAFGSDVTEINPPLWFWEAMPASALADRLGIAVTHLAVVMTLARTGIALALTALLLPLRGRAATMAGLSVVTLTLPLFVFAERDHLAVLGVLPYAALLACRAEQRPVSLAVGLAVGLFAAWGFALKPYFALPPLFLEGWLLLRLRRDWRPLRAETLTLAGAAVAYGLAVTAFAPGWWTHALPLARAAYADFAPPFAWLFERQAYLPFWVLAALALALARPRGAQVQAAIVAALGFFGCYLLQGKGFPYHALPVTVMLAAALWMLLCEDARPLLVMARRPLATLALGVLLTTVTLVGLFARPSLGRIDGRIAALPPGTVFMVISAHSWHAFPLVEDHRFIWPFPGGITLMPLPAILREGDTPRGRSLRRTTIDMLADAMERCPPQAILIDDPAESTVLPAGADYLRFLNSDPRTAAWLSRYRIVARSDGRQLLMARPGGLAPARRCFVAPPPAA
jgi:hypothetical protein